MRISEQNRYSLIDRKVRDARGASNDAMTELSTQKRINATRDDPVGLSSVIRKKDELAEFESYQKNVNFTKGFLAASESAVASIVESLARAKDLAVAMSNGTYSASSRDATAKEVGQILDQVLNSANSKFGAKYVFSGFRVDSPAFARDGVYLGDDGAIFLQVGREKFNRVNLSGRELFEVSEEEQMTGRMSLIDSLKFFKDALERNEVHDIHRVSDELSFHQEKISSFQASIGAMSNTIDNIGQNLELMIDYEKKAISEIEDADMYQTTSNFKRTEAALQATLVASNKVLQPSLLNFFQ